jgi:Protein of unknown function (DUF2568)
MSGAGERPMSPARWAALALRGIMEAGVVAGMAQWGYHTGRPHGMSILLAIVSPVVVFGFWGLVDFHWLGRPAEAVRLVQELAITGLVAAALIVSGQPMFGWALAIVSVVHHALLYANGDRLLPDRP